MRSGCRRATKTRRAGTRSSSRSSDAQELLACLLRAPLQTAALERQQRGQRCVVAWRAANARRSSAASSSGSAFPDHRGARSVRRSAALPRLKTCAPKRAPRCRQAARARHAVHCESSAKSCCVSSGRSCTSMSFEVIAVGGAQSVLECTVSGQSNDRSFELVDECVVQGSVLKAQRVRSSAVGCATSGDALNVLNIQRLVYQGCSASISRDACTYQRISFAFSGSRAEPDFALTHFETACYGFFLMLYVTYRLRD